MSPQWHVLYTRHQWEMKVANRLADKMLEHYCPMNMVEKPGRRKIVSEVLFSSWVFVRATESELPALCQMNGVVNMVYWLGKPVVVPEKEIAGITQFVNEHKNIRLDRSVVCNTTMIRTIQSFDQYDLETLSIPSLGIALSALVKLPQLELVQDEVAFNYGLRYAFL